jgi:trehalose synthase-fused probable maltokinase
MAPTVPADRLARRARGLDAGWIAGQRWFRAKTRRVEAVTPRDAAELGDGSGWLLVLGVAYADGGEDRYLVPAVVDGASLREPRDGDGLWRALVGRIAAGGVLPAERGRFGFEATPALAELLPGGADEAGGLDERVQAVEQSNSSAVLGDRLFLKVYRLLEPGTNPEVEVSAFLTAVGFPHAPALAGAITYLPDEGEPCAAGMLQAFLPARGDGWRWVLGRLAAGPDGAGEAVADATQIGGITAELHAALASRPDAPGFPARLATLDELAAWRASAEAQLQGAIEALTGDSRARLEAVAPTIAERLAAIQDADTARATRIHGDYHLGQLLRTERGFAVIDFEGEPARPLPERRQPASPLRDVAGMLRSLDYAARTAQRGGAIGFEPDAWLSEARAAFLSAYGGLPPGGERLLAAFELEKACYEVRYEANNRPEWTWLPLAALERLVA